MPLRPLHLRPSQQSQHETIPLLNPTIICVLLNKQNIHSETTLLLEQNSQAVYGFRVLEICGCSLPSAGQKIILQKASHLCDYSAVQKHEPLFTFFQNYEFQRNLLAFYLIDQLKLAKNHQMVGKFIMVFRPFSK